MRGVAGHHCRSIRQSLGRTRGGTGSPSRRVLGRSRALAEPAHTTGDVAPRRRVLQRSDYRVPESDRVNVYSTTTPFRMVRMRVLDLARSYPSPNVAGFPSQPAYVQLSLPELCVITDCGGPSLARIADAFVRPFRIEEMNAGSSRVPPCVGVIEMHPVSKPKENTTVVVK